MKIKKGNIKINDFMVSLNTLVIDYNDHQYKFEMKEIVKGVFGELCVPTKTIRQDKETKKHNIVISYADLSELIEPEKIKKAVEADKKCKSSIEQIVFYDSTFIFMCGPFIVAFLLGTITFLLKYVFKDIGHTGEIIIIGIVMLFYLILFGMIIVFLEDIVIKELGDTIKSLSSSINKKS